MFSWPWNKKRLENAASSVRPCLSSARKRRTQKRVERERLTLSNETHFNNEKKRRRATHTYTGAQSLCVCVWYMFSALRVFFLFFFRRWVKQTQKSSKDRAVAAFKGIEEETFSSSSSSGKRKEKTARMDLNNETRSIWNESTTGPHNVMTDSRGRLPPRKWVGFH